MLHSGESEAMKSLRLELEAGRKLYALMRKKLQSEESVVDMLKELQVYLEPAVSAQQTMDASQALWILAQLQANLANFFGDFDFYLGYIEKMQRMVELDQREKASRTAPQESDPVGVGTPAAT